MLTDPLETPTIPVGRGQRLTPLWHCFGANACEIDRQTIIDMLLVSRTALFPINTHDLDGRGLIIGNGSVAWEEIRQVDLIARMVPCLNINLRTSAAAAVDVTRRAFAMTGVDLLKLEVLNEDMRVANDEQVVAAARELARDGFRVMPLITANADAARELIALGCPLLRVQGSPIGSGQGILDEQAVKEIVQLRSGVPVILDCGIGSPDHALHALRLGCAGFLVDYLLFKAGDPVAALRELRARLRNWQWTGYAESVADADAVWEAWWDSRARA